MSNPRPCRIMIGTKIRHKNGIDYIVDSMPNKNKFYCRTADSKKEFKVVFLEDVEFIHAAQIRLNFPVI